MKKLKLLIAAGLFASFGAWAANASPDATASSAGTVPEGAIRMASAPSDWDGYDCCIIFIAGAYWCVPC